MLSSGKSHPIALKGQKALKLILTIFTATVSLLDNGKSIAANGHRLIILTIVLISQDIIVGAGF